MFRKFLVNLLIPVLVFVAHLTHATARVNNTTLQPFNGLVSEPVFNEKVYFQMRGNPAGAVVFLVHGLDDNASNIWQETVTGLVDDYFVATLDLPGFGQSSKSNQAYTPENYVRIIRHLSRTYIRQPFHLTGHSMGGAISLRYAATYPEDVQTLTLVDAAGILHRLSYTKYLAPMGLKHFSGIDYIDSNAITSLAGLVMNKAEGLMMPDLRQLVQIPLLRAKVLQGKPLTIAGLALVVDDFRNIPQSIEAPTRIIWGEDDNLAPLRTGHVLNTLIPDSSLHVIPNAGHTPMQSHPSAFQSLLAMSFKPDSPFKAVEFGPAKIQDKAGCNGQNNSLFSGRIKDLTITNCKNILVKDASIGRLVIDNSRVQLENVTVTAPDRTAVEISNSNVMFTAGRINGRVAIAAQNSRLDIAGTTLAGTETAISAQSVTDIIFSLTPVQGGLQQGTVLHGRKKLLAGEKL